VAHAGAPPIAPSDGDGVARATLGWIRANVQGAHDARWQAQLQPAADGLATFIWFGQLEGIDVADGQTAWTEPLVIRVFSETREDETLHRESALIEHVRAQSYPVPEVIARVPSDAPGNELGLPHAFLSRAPGGTMLGVITSRPWAARRLLRDLAALQHRLHRLDTTGVQLKRDGPLVDRWFARWADGIDSLGDARASRVLQRMRDMRSVVADERPVICHGDYHPLNVLTARTPGSKRGPWTHTVIDWTDAVFGDAHFDVARTIALFGVAAIGAHTRIERALAPPLGRWGAGVYRRAYERFAPLDDARLAYWSAAHLVRGWWQIEELHRTAGSGAWGRGNPAAVPRKFASLMLERAEAALDSIAR
jgi:aminoglycoside phosphotransferase (APT) family kinase protein